MTDCRYLGLASELVQQPSMEGAAPLTRAASGSDVTSDEQTKMRVCTKLAQLFGIPVC